MGKRRQNGEGSVYQRTDGLWVAAVTLGWENGRRKRKTVAAKTAEEARAKLRRIEARLDAGLPLDDDLTTVNALLDRWLDLLTHQVAQPAVSNYRTIADTHLRPALGTVKVAKLTTAQIDRLLVAKLRGDAAKGVRPLSVSTVRRIRSVLAQALTQGQRWGVVARNVASLSAVPKAQRAEGRSLEPDEARRLIEALADSPRRDLFVTMLATGLRRGEALGLRWSDIDLEAAKLTVRRQLRREDGGGLVPVEPKTRRSRRELDLPSIAVDALRAQRERQAKDAVEAGERWQEAGYVFTSTVGTPLDPRNVSRDFAAAAFLAGLGRWHIHELRHSAASLMLAAGVPIEVVSEHLGHASIRITADTYGHVAPAQRRAAADALGAAIA